MAENGLLGYGFNLSGISVISRAPATYYFDGMYDEVDFNADDKYTLDGNRMYTSGSNSYFTYSESFNKITSTDTDSDGSPERFTVVTPSGAVLEYGLTAASRLVHSPSGKVIQWYIEKITDANGNYIQFNYITNNNRILISTIKYTGTVDFAPYNEVRFKYSYRDDKSTTYLQGEGIGNQVLLDEVVVRSEEAMVRKYTFHYLYNGIYSLLNEVVLTGSDGQELNSTVTGWAAPGSNQTISLGADDLFTTTLLTGQRLTGDLNGDGKTDIFYGSGSTSQVQVFLKKTGAAGFSYKGNFTTLSSGKYSLCDVNNDNKDEIIIQKFILGKIKIICYSYDESANQLTLLNNNTFNIMAIGDENISYECKDLDGDKIPENILIQRVIPDPDDLSTSSLLIMCWNNDWTSSVSRIFNYSSQYDICPYGASLIQFKGSAKKEIVVRYYNTEDPDGDYKYVVCEYTGTAISTITSFWAEKDLEFSDINGDGKDDAVDFGDNNRVVLNDGTGYDDDYIILPGGSEVKDLNGDGKNDIYTGNTVYYSYGNGLTAASLPSHGGTYELVDMNDDGHLDILDITNEQAIILNNPFKKPLLSSVTNGMNNRINIEYQSTGEGGSFYSAPDPPGTGLIKSVKPKMCVSGAQFLPDAGNPAVSEELTYQYRNAVEQPQLGFICFKTVIVSSSVNNSKATTTLGVDPAYYYPYIDNTLVTNYSGTQNIQSTAYVNAKYTYNSGKSYRPYISQSTQVNFLDDVKSVTNRTYDAAKYALPLSASVSYYNGASGSTLVSSEATSTVYTSYTINTKTVYKPQSQTVTKTRNSQTFSQVTSYTYTNGGKNTFTVSTPLLTTTYRYNNNYGIPYRVELTSGGQTRYSELAFDSRYRFAVSETNTLGQTVTTEYDHKTGNALMSADAEGLRTSYTYDGFGRLTGKTLPDMNQVTYSTVWAEDEITGSLYKATAQQQGFPAATTYFNRQGKEIRSVGKNMNGQSIYKDTEYYTDGKLKRQSNAYNTSYNSKIWTTYAYDSYNRVHTLQTDGTGNTTTWGYSGRTVSVTQTNGYNKSTTVNADGTTASVTDNGGTITYYYHKTGAIDHITAPGKTVTFGYDTYGRRTSVNDQSYGNVSYSYNNFSELTTQATPSATYTMTYDLLGRPLTVSTETLEKTFVYDTRKEGMLSTVGLTENGESSSVNYYYDNLGRVSSVTENHSGESFTTGYTYNTYGQPASMKYPNNFTVKYSYSNGQLQYVRREDNTLIWQGVGQHPNGSYTESTLGNGLTTQINYNNYNFVTGISALNTSTSTYVMNQHYTWDMVHGQMTGRSDLVKGLNESYTYDPQGRLKTFTDAQGSQHTMQYSSSGDITSKYDAGTYTYNTSHKGAVEELDPVTGIDPLTGEEQEIDYTDYDKVNEILQEGKQLNIYYGPGFGRSRTEMRVSGHLEKTKLYASGGLYETQTDDQGHERQLCYIMGGNGLCAVYEVSGTTGTMYYTHTDHLGSVNAVTNQNKTVVEEMSFDAWGRRRNPANWTYSGVPTTHTIDRGYTGHEHLDQFGLINMNGRMYDPLLGRFLSPDKFVQAPGNTQNYNSYSYCLNNPLKYTDPSGYVLIDAMEYEEPGCSSISALYSGSTDLFPVMGTAFSPGSLFDWDMAFAMNMQAAGLGNDGLEGVRNGLVNGAYNGKGVVTYTGDAAKYYYASLTGYVSKIINRNSDRRLGYFAGFDDLYFEYDVKTKSYYIPYTDIKVNPADVLANLREAASDGAFTQWYNSVDWKEVGNAFVSLGLGVVEIIGGASGEVFTAGLSTAIVADGLIRVATNGTKLFFLLQGKTRIGSSTPSNLGGWIGKGVDLANGASYGQIGLGQGIGSFVNDFSTFVITGGSAMALQQSLAYPSFWTVSQYGFILTGTPYSAYSDAKSAGF